MNSPSFDPASIVRVKNVYAIYQNQELNSTKKYFKDVL